MYANLYGFYYKDNLERRRFRQAYIEVARKNGKTTGLLFPQILYDFLVTDAAESYLVSKDTAQAEKSFRELKAIIKADSDLTKVSECFTNSVLYQNSRIAFFSSESTAIDGYRNSLSIIDEFHCYDNDKIVTAFRYGSRARLNGLVAIITSAGLDISNPCYAENKKCKSILNNTLTDESYFGIIYAYDEKDDWKDCKNFIKANPSLGCILKPDVLESDLNDALITPSHQGDFKSKTCGFWVNEKSSWIPLNKWKQYEAINYETLETLPCYGALDLSSVNDMTAYSLCWYLNGKYYFKHLFYIPEETVQERYRKENINFLEWIEKGYVKTTAGSTINYEEIYSDIVKDARRYRIEEIAYDRWQANFLIEKLNSSLPEITYIDYDQSLKNFASPTKAYERLALEEKIIDPNPVILWQLQNVMIKPDVNNNYKPLKEYKSSTKRIDGIITSIMARDRCEAAHKAAPAVSFDTILHSF
nr:terminase TerL endonuclease subunit [Treponema vincentii]